MSTNLRMEEVESWRLLHSIYLIPSMWSPPTPSRPSGFNKVEQKTLQRDRCSSKKNCEASAPVEDTKSPNPESRIVGGSYKS